MGERERERAAVLGEGMAAAAAVAALGEKVHRPRSSSHLQQQYENSNSTEKWLSTTTRESRTD